MSTISAFAIDSPLNIVADDITENSLRLSWDSVDDALGYQIYFSNSSPVEKSTAEKTDYIDGLEHVIDNLSEGTKYNFIVTTLDIEAEESDFTDEISFTTL